MASAPAGAVPLPENSVRPSRCNICTAICEQIPFSVRIQTASPADEWAISENSAFAPGCSVRCPNAYPARTVFIATTPEREMCMGATPVSGQTGVEQLTVWLADTDTSAPNANLTDNAGRVSGCTYSPPQRNKTVSREGADGSLILLRCQHEHWHTPNKNVTPTPGSRPVIGRRAQGFKARRREGVTRTRPEDRVVRATNQATPYSRWVSTSSCRRPGIRGTESRPPGRARNAAAGPGNRYPGTGQQWPTSSVTVTRTLEFTFNPAVRWLMEPLFRRRLPVEVRDEIQRAKAYLERGTG